MDQPEVRVVQLPPMRVASVYGFGQQPEDEAWRKMAEWAGPLGILGRREEHRVFGFNNPSPSPGSPNYGYELWIAVSGEAQAGGEVELKDFPGGLYAVARCPMAGDPVQTIPAAWRQLVIWREESQFRPGQHQWLEEHLFTPDMPPEQWVLDLYLPLAR